MLLANVVMLPWREKGVSFNMILIQASFGGIALAAILGYVAGSIPFGLVLTKLAGLGDVRDIGSGNIGTTNVLRTGNKGLAAVTLAADILKGTAGVLIGHTVAGPGGALVGGFGAFLGHLFPVWLGFKGGKGVATYIGVLLGLAWPAALIFCVIWLLVAVISRYSSLSALVASAAAPLIMAFTGSKGMVAVSIVITLLVFVRHHENIRRLLSGNESKIG